MCKTHACADCRATSLEPSLLSQSGQMGNVSRGEEIVMLGVDMNVDNVQLVVMHSYIEVHDSPLINLRGITCTSD